MAALGEDLAKVADSQLVKFRQHPEFSTHGNIHTTLLQLTHSVKTCIRQAFSCDETIGFREKLEEVEPLREEGPAVLAANDPLAIKV